ncbi:hypothetical protein PO124_35375, partial [Bacillus licheniformis]|nr:hypothetical protein [Bacillus licheniformis]
MPFAAFKMPFTSFDIRDGRRDSFPLFFGIWRHFTFAWGKRPFQLKENKAYALQKLKKFETNPIFTELCPPVRERGGFKESLLPK